VSSGTSAANPRAGRRIRGVHGFAAVKVPVQLWASERGNEYVTPESVAAVDRNLPAKAFSGKETGARVGEDGGLDPRVMHDRLYRELFSADLLAPRERGSLAKFASAGPIGIGSDQDECRVAACRVAKNADAIRIDPGRSGRSAEHDGPRWISAVGSEQGYHIAPVRAGPSASARTSISRKPAACANVAMKQRAITTTNLAACIGGSPGHAGRHAFTVEPSCSDCKRR
jgi:hypothetical protein